MIAQLLKTNLYSIRVRLSLILFAVFVLLALIAVIAIINEQQRQALHSSEQELRTIGSLSQASFNRALRLEMPEVIEELTTELQAQRRIQRVLLVSEQGLVLSAYNKQYLKQHASAVISHFNAELFASTATSGLLSFQFITAQQLFLLYLPLLAPGEDYSRPARQLLLLEYRHESSWLTALLHRWKALLIALVILSLTSALLWRYLQRTLADPVARLVQALAEVSSGKSLQLPPGERRSEIGQLTQAIESMVRQRQADEAEQTGDAAGHHGDQLLGAGADEVLIDEVRRQHAEEVPEEQEEHADVEQVAAQPQLAAAQQLRGVALPRVLVAVETQQAADEEHREADVGVVAEQQVVEPGCHGCTPSVAEDLRTRWMGCTAPGLAWPCDEQPSKASGSAQLSSSGSSGAMVTA